jgi:hypothetical protein
VHKNDHLSEMLNKDIVSIIISFADFKSLREWRLVSKFCKAKANSYLQDQVSWYWIMRLQKLSEDFIRDFQDRVDWYNISQYQKLSEDFIREFKDKVEWSGISIFQKLSEDFICEFQDKVNWECISCCQQLSEDFRREFKVKDRVNWQYQNLSET